MALYFDKVSLLALNQEFKSLGAGFNYSNTKTFTMEGIVNDLHNVVGVSGILSGIAHITDEFYSYQTIVLNGINFGSGRVLSLNFNASNDVQLNRYTASVSTFNNGDLSNLTGPLYSSVNTSNWLLLDNFTESYNFTRKENGGYSYIHNANIQFFQGPTNINALDAAKALAQSLFVGSPALGVDFYAGFTEKVGKRFYTETYDVVNNACAFQETFDFDADDGNYSFIYTDTIELQANGIVNVTENGIIKGIVSPNFSSAKEGFDAQFNGAITRCQDAITNYTYGNNAYASLKTTPISQNINYNLFIGEISYAVAFTNDPKYYNTYFWTYTTEQAQQDGYYIASENGSIIGRADNRPDAYDNAKAGAATAIAGIGTRILAFEPSLSTSFYQIGRTRSDSPFKGIVNYSAQYSAKPSLLIGTTNKVDVVVEDNASVYQYNKFGIFNVGNILQNAESSLPKTRTVNLIVYGQSSQELNTYRTIINGIINNYKLTDGIVTNCNYSYSPNNNIMTCNAEWVAAGDADTSINI